VCMCVCACVCLHVCVSVAVSMCVYLCTGYGVCAVGENGTGRNSQMSALQAFYVVI